MMRCLSKIESPEIDRLCSVGVDNFDVLTATYGRGNTVASGYELEIGHFEM